MAHGEQVELERCQKLEFQIIGTNPMLKKASTKKLNIHIQNKPIKQVFQCKTLGVTLDENLLEK